MSHLNHQKHQISAISPDEAAIRIAERIVSLSDTEHSDMPIGWRINQISDLANALLHRLCETLSQTGLSPAGDDATHAHPSSRSS